MHQVQLRGSYRQMGHQQGHSLRETCFNLPPPDPKMLRFARQCEELVGQFAPELLDELHALAEASKVDYAALLTVTLTAPYDASEVPAEAVPAAGCTVLAVLPERTVDGRPIVGRNYDYFHDVSEEGATTYRTYPEGRYASLGDCDI